MVQTVWINRTVSSRNGESESLMIHRLLNSALAWGIVIGALFCTVVIVGADQADAVAPQSQVKAPCADQWQHPRSHRAETCRRYGWVIAPGVVITPNHVLRYMYLPVCRAEDGDTRTCEINVTGRFGDGCGKAWVFLVHNGHHRWVSLFRWVKDGHGRPHLERWVRWPKTCGTRV